MKAIEFKEQTTIFAKNQPPYNPLPAFVDDDKDRIVVSCYKLSLLDIIRVIFLGKIWVGQMTFSNPLQPQKLSTKKSDLIVTR